MAEVLARIGAKFDEFEKMERALGSLKVAGVTRYDAYGPISLAHLESYMNEEDFSARGLLSSIRNLPSRVLSVFVGQDGSPVRFHSTAGAITGLIVFFLMCVLTSLIFKLVVGGKPPISNVPYVVPAYEGTILLGAIGAFVAGLYYSRLLRGPRLLPGYDGRYSSDTFGIDVSCEREKVSDVMDVLRSAGAVEVYEY